VKNPERQLGAEVGQLMFWQLAGIGIVAPRAMAVLDTAADVTAHGASWDPDRELVAPTTVKNGTGDYTITWPATAPDENGTAVAIVLVAADASPQTDSAKLFANAKIQANGRSARVKIWTDGGVATDCDVLIKVW
jgi:hypothetical protein